jgi:hypothetical protein
VQVPIAGMRVAMNASLDDYLLTLLNHHNHIAAMTTKISLTKVN